MQPHANAMGTGEDRRTQPDAARRMRGLHDQSALKPATGLMMEVAIRCTVPSCSCECFTPGKLNIRYCEGCNHSWVPHALDKLGGRHSQPCVEPVQPNAAFDIASLVLYGCQALPIRLKILLDRLFSVLRREEVLHVLAGFGWTHDDYARGYILQEAHGATLERWHICSAEEEPLVLRQFLRFGETRAIALQLLAAAAASASPRLLDHPEVRRPPGRPRRPSPPRRPPTPPHPVAPPVRPPPPPPMSPLQKMNYLKLPTTPNNMSNNSNGSLCSPPGIPVSSPMSVSPLNRLQSMQPFDFRKMNNADLTSRRRLSDTPSDSSPPGLMNLTLSSPCLPPPPGPLAAVSSANCYTSALSATALMPGVLPPPPLPPPPPPPPVHQNNVSDSKSPAIDMLSGTGSSDFGSEEDDDEENFQSALNLSRDGVGLYKVRQRPGHVRKTSTPMKRQWGSGMGDLPLNLGTQLVNPATGKKRVQCNVCLKTFCDKGALKIHFSAVHLREMHKCTVDGCNMMFSSRRSRNRHSANPNPKLHSPHLRRKISPHDGRSAQTHHLLVPPPPPGSLALGPLSFPPFPLLAQPHLPKHSLDLTMHRFDERRLDFSNNTNSSEDIMTYSNHQSDDDDDGFDDEEDGIVVDGGVDDDDNEEKVEEEHKRLHNGLSENADESDNSAKRPKISESDADDDIASNLDSNDDSLSVVDTNSIKEENGPESAVALTRNARKRKNQNPTRCAVAPLMEAHDSMTDEESSADIYSVPVPDDGVCNKSPKIENNLENFSPKGKDTLDEGEECRKDQAVTRDGIETERESANQVEEKPENTDNNTGSDNEDTFKEKHDDHTVENIEKKSKNEEQIHVNADNNTDDQLPKDRVREAEPLEDDEDSPNSRGSDVSLSSSHALRRLESLSQGPFGDMGFPGGPPSPARSHGSSSNDSPSDDAHYFFPETGGFIGSMDVPIDKDNPRRCTACGKIFQNHFGVKTHFQNVHLKLMHKCTVEGCNAAFPSKRSRDRHSANLNLHRKLLSTSSSDKSGAALFMDNSPFASLASNPSLHGEFLARLYAESQSLPLNLEAAFKSLPPLGPPPPGSLAEQFLLNGDRLPPPPHPGLLLPPLGFPGFPSHLLAGINGDRKDDSASMSPPSAKTSAMSQPGFSVEDDPPSPDRDGRFPCVFCQQPLVDAAALKDHYDTHHLMELHRCGTCGKMFASRERRQTHMESAHAPTPSALTACS